MPTRTPPRLIGDLTPSSLTAFLGDSITKGNGTNGANTTVFGGRSYPILACQAAGGALKPYIVAGTNGDTTAGMLARLTADVLTLRSPKPGRCVVLGGTNDAIQGVATATTLANLAAIYDRLRAAGIEPYGATVPPYASNRTGVSRLNAGIVALCEARGMVCFDFNRALADPATGGYVATYDDDGIHPSHVGQRVMAGVMAATLAAWERAPVPALARDDGDGVNLIDAGLFTGDANADGVGNFWTNNATTGGGTVTPSIETGDATVVGNWQVMTQTVAGQKILSQTVPAGQTSPRGWAVGEVLEFSCLLSATVEAGGLDPTIELIPSGAAVSYAPVFQQAADVTRGYVSCRFAVPTGTTGLIVRLKSSWASAGTGVMKVAQATLHNLTRLGVA